MSLKFVSIPPYKYVHVRNTETNIVELYCGPQNLTLTQDKVQEGGIMDMLVIKENEHAIIQNPVIRGENGQCTKAPNGFIKTRIGFTEYRTRKDFQEPFPLYPGEKHVETKQNLQVLRNQCLEVEVIDEWTNPLSGTVHVAGEIYMINGPTTYIPASELQVVSVHTATNIIAGQAIEVMSTRNHNDVNGKARLCGEQYLYREAGSYMPIVGENFVKVLDPKIITEEVALYLQADITHTDVFGVERKAGDEWLVTCDMAREYIVDVGETLVCNVKRMILDQSQYLTIRNYVDGNGVQQWGALKLVNGPTSVHLRPHEVAEGGVHNHDILKDSEALLLFAEKAFTDHTGTQRYSGEKWLFKGPGMYCPSINVKILERRKATPLAEDEGIYIKDEITGEVRAHIGSTYMLTANEVLFEKELSPELEELYAIEKCGVSYIPPKMVNGQLTYVKPDISGYKRDRHRVISYSVPFNRCVQLYNFKTRESRVVFGPYLVLLQPDEIFTVLGISGGRPKVENAIKSFSLMLGPDFMTDLVVVETSDHAAIEIELAYGWEFHYDRENPKNPENRKLFAIKDFIGNACKSVSSRIRGAISAISYDEFHHKSARIIKQAVFGIDKTTGNIRTELKFPANGLVIRSCDIKMQRPVEKSIEEKLKKNTFLAIQIKTTATELEYKAAKELYEQNSKGLLAIQAIEDKTKAESEKIEYYKAKAEKDSIESIGVSIAKAKAESAKAGIEGKSRLNLAELDAQYEDLMAKQARDALQRQYDAEFKYDQRENEISLNENRSMSEVEVDKVSRLMKAVGQNTLTAMMNAEPEMQQEMLKSLGLQGYLMTDGRNPINLFDTAQGLVHQQAMGKM